MGEKLAVRLETKMGELGSALEVKMGTLGGEIVEAVDKVMFKHVKEVRADVREFNLKLGDAKAALRTETDQKITEHVTAYHQ